MQTGRQGLINPWATGENAPRSSQPRKILTFNEKLSCWKISSGQPYYETIFSLESIECESNCEYRKKFENMWTRAAIFRTVNYILEKFVVEKE